MTSKLRKSQFTSPSRSAIFRFWSALDQARRDQDWHQTDRQWLFFSLFFTIGENGHRKREREREREREEREQPELEPNRQACTYM